MALLQGNGDVHLFLWFCCEESDDSNVVAFLYGDDFFFFFGAYGLIH